MIAVVADASVIVKWALPVRHDEPDASIALDLLRAVQGGRLELIQPPHWLAEVAGVLVRLSPATARADIASLCEMEIPVADSPEIYLTACALAVELHHHLFDTLYHAVALHHTGSVFITADERYFRKAKRRGRIRLLGDARAIVDR